jgi:radical SAM protein
MAVDRCVTGPVSSHGRESRTQRSESFVPIAFSDRSHSNQQMAARRSLPLRAMPPVDFDQAPMLVFWETTQACTLRCGHCRAAAIAEPSPGQLSTDEGLRLIDDIATFSPRRPVVILTGGDPLMRPDFYALAEHARALGLPLGVAPSVTPLLTREAARRLRGLDVKTISVSLDGACAATHDAVRGVDGHFARTADAVRMLVAEGHTVQINTTVMRQNVTELADILALLVGWGVHIWEVFFLVGVGRGAQVAELSPSENEDVAQFLAEAACHGPVVRTVEAPFFRRVVAARSALSAACDPTTYFGLGPLYRRLAAVLQERLGPPGPSRAQSVGTRDGKGIIFVSHAGDVFPAGFLPVALGNVRTGNIVDIYRDHPLLRAIRATRFSGRCGACEWAQRCGGSRARSFAVHGDVLAEDPACGYTPTAADSTDRRGELAPGSRSEAVG